MRKKPKGRTYRNLFARGGAIYYERVIHGDRVCFSTKSNDWDEAAGVRDLWEKRKGVAHGAALPKQTTFGELADRYLQHGLADASDRYRRDHERLLGPPTERQHVTPRAHFADVPVVEIGTRALGEYERRLGRSWRTTKTHMVAITQVLKLAVLDEIVTHNAGRAYVEARARRQKGSETEPNPIHDPRDLARFIEASEQRGGAHHLATLIALDAGLRPSEIRGLRWEDWSRGSGGGRPYLQIARAINAAGVEEPPKTVHARRRVHASQRLCRALSASRLKQGNPDTGAILPGWRTRAYAVHFAACMKAVGIGGHTPYDLRRTHASILFSLHVPERYVVRQMGHADLSTTTRHYARWIADDDDLATPPKLRDGECWADLIAQWSQQTPNISQTPRGTMSRKYRNLFKKSPRPRSSGG